MPWTSRTRLTTVSTFGRKPGATGPAAWRPSFEGQSPSQPLLSSFADPPVEWRFCRLLKGSVIEEPLSELRQAEAPLLCEVERFEGLGPLRSLRSVAEG